MTPISRLTLRLQSDSRLVELAASGHEPAFEAIVERYRSPLLRYCARLLPSDRAEDVVQQTFENALTALRGDDRPRQLRPWLYRIAHNLAINALHKNGWDHEQLDENYDGVPQPPDVVGQRHRLEGLVQNIRELPDRQRSALVLREFEGRSYDEIARELDATPPIVRQLLHRARTRLRDSVGLLVPLPLIRALLTGGAQGAGTEQVAGAAAGAGAGAGIAKVGVSLFAAATLAGGAGVAVQQGGDNHRTSDSRPNATQSRPQAASTSQGAVLADDSSGRASTHGLANESHGDSSSNAGDRGHSGNENDGAHTGERRDSPTEQDQDRGGDEEKGDRHGSPDDDDEQGTESRVSGKEDDEPKGSEDQPGSDSGSGHDTDAGSDPGSSESSGSGGQGGEGSDSAPSAPEEPAAPPA